MTWFLESPWPSLVLGVSLELVLAIALVRTGRAVILAAMAVVLALTLAMLAIERLVVTPTEEVEDALQQVAAALVAGDAPAVMAALSPKCPRRGEVQSILSHVTVSSARIGGDLEVRFSELTSAPMATAYFTAIVEAKDNRGALPYDHFVRKFKVTLRKQDGRWLIDDYAEAEPHRKGPSGAITKPG